MAKTKKPASAKRIIDVAHPGKSAPASTSKSVIVSNRPLLKDPMMLDDGAAPTADSAESSSPQSPAQPTIRLQTAPLLKGQESPKTSEASKPTKEPKAVTIAELAAVAAAKKPTSSDDKPESSKTEAPKPLTPPKAADSVKPAADSPEEPAAKTKEKDPAVSPDEITKQLASAAAEQAKHTAAVQKLVDSKQYFLPINAVEKRRSKQFVLLGIVVSILLALAWVDIALDAGLIQIDNVKPLTHLFSN